MSFVATPDLEVICVVVLVVTFAFNGGTNAGHIQNIIGLAPNRFQTLVFETPISAQVGNSLRVHKWSWEHKRIFGAGDQEADCPGELLCLIN